LNKNLVVFPALVLGFAALAQAQGLPPTPSKVAIIHVQNAILSTKDGQKAATDLQTSFLPKQTEIEKRRTEIAALQEQLRKGNATMAEEAKATLMRDIDAKNKVLTRETEDAQADLDSSQGKIMQELGNKMMAVIEKYSNQNGYALVLDVSNPQTPVLWAASAIDITNDIVKLYDQANPGAAPPAGTATKPAVPAAPKGVMPTMTPPPPAAKKK
jgi:outer membrane protein